MDGADRIRTPFGAFLRGVGDDLADAASGPARPAPVVDRSTWRRLLQPIIPRHGESLRGLVARACWENDVPNSYGILQHLGLNHRNRVLVAEDVEIDPAELACAIRVNEDEVRIRRYEPVRPGRVSFFGLSINPRRIETRTRRFSPTAFQADVGDMPQYHRALWELSDIPFCLQAWDMLQDRCGCEIGGVVQRWTRTATRVEECDRCGDPLAWIEPVPVPERMRPSLGILATLLPERLMAGLDVGAVLPEPLRTIDRGPILDMVVSLTRAIDPGSSERPFEEAEARLEALHSACDALVRWPDGLTDVDLDPDVSRVTAERLRVTWHGLAPLARAGGGPRTDAAAAVPPNGASVTKPVGIRPATEIARLSPEVLTAVWEHGLVTRHRRVHGARLLPAYDPAELTALGDAWRARREPAALAYELGLPLYGLEQLAALGTLVADAVSLPSTGPFFTPGRVDTFLEALTNGQRPVADPVALRQSMRRIGGRLEAWGRVIGALLSGDIPYVLVGNGRLIDRIAVSATSRDAIDALASGPCGDDRAASGATMIQRDALEVLNAPQDGAELLAGLATSGINPRTYRIGDVVRRAGEIVVLPEIAAILGQDSTSVYEAIVRCGIGNEVKITGVWPRDLLPQIIRAFEERRG
ncbi:hypothetical protein QE361_003610 [Sphingomonas sp. SORGH_AS802]|uniref:hypothetical protein n=1 Tax=unclassified Sphingomonas TaxID=196159 RepID=UPI00285A472D|nr:MULTISPECIES: hypothetical protein [unclassified Sphingomonas]MDR6126092.1 hypothetical protein [Sphingomonas sp. SORGH_AS_0438]MDR6136602.1 hypothetical protein [Sphingomonas sp. SORGH_AS_0802]